MPVSPLGRTVAVVDEEGVPTQELSIFTEEVARLNILAGSGSPEGVVEARQKRLYMDTAGTAGSILYIKRNDDVAGNRKNGWILV